MQEGEDAVHSVPPSLWLAARLHNTFIPTRSSSHLAALPGKCKDFDLHVTRKLITRSELLVIIEELRGNYDKTTASSRGVTLTEERAVNSPMRSIF